MIQLTKDLWMKADDCCYIVGKARQGRGKGRELRDPTYHPTVAQAVSAALSRAMRQGVADGSITTLRQFIQEQERLSAELEKLLAPLKSAGKAGESRGKGRPDVKTGDCIPQAQDGENKAHPTYIVKWCDHEGKRHELTFDNQDSAQFKAQELEKEFSYVAILRESEVDSGKPKLIFRVGTQLLAPAD